VGNILAYLRDAIREFCEKNLHSGVLFEQSNFSQIILNRHLVTAIATITFWHSVCSDIFRLKLLLLLQASFMTIEIVDIQKLVKVEFQGIGLSYLVMKKSPFNIYSIGKKGMR
jgi:hypothetical protein